MSWSIRAHVRVSHAHMRCLCAGYRDQYKMSNISGVRRVYACTGLEVPSKYVLLKGYFWFKSTIIIEYPLGVNYVMYVRTMYDSDAFSYRAHAICTS